MVYQRSRACIFIKLLITTVLILSTLSISQARNIGSVSTQQSPTTIDWSVYWNLHDWYYAPFQNYFWQNGQWVKQDGQITIYGVAPRTSIPKYDEPGEWDNVWRLQFLKPVDCVSCYWGSGFPENTRVYVRQFDDFYAILGESRTAMADGATALNDGLGVNGRPAHGEPHANPLIRSFYRTKQVPGSQFPYILSPSQPSTVTTAGCLSSPVESFWTTGRYSQEYYGYYTGTPDRGRFAGGAPSLGTGDWTASACWLGQATVGPHTGNVVVLSFEEPLYGVLESWALMEGVGLVQVEQWVNGTPKIRMTIMSSHRLYLPVVRNR